MTRLYLVKTEGGDLIGWDNDDAKYIANMGDGECIECDTRKARNPGQHKKFFALFDNAYLNQERYTNKKAFMIALKLKCGWYEEHVTSRGELVYIPVSLSWANMPQETFEKFYDDAMKALAEMSRSEQIEAEADQIIARAG